MLAHRLPLLLFVACFLPRLAYLIWWPPAERNYFWELADSILTRGSYELGGLPDTSIEPGYPALLAALRRLTSDRDRLTAVALAAAAAAAGPLIFALGRRLTGRQEVGVVAALLYAVHPYLVRQASAYQSLTLTLILLVVSAHAFLRMDEGGSAIPLGAALGATVLTNASMGALLAGTTILLALERRPLRAAAVLATGVLVLLPWHVRSHRVDGSWMPSRAGENLFVSTFEHSRDLLPGYDVDLVVGAAFASIAPEVAALNSPREHAARTADRLLRDRALDYARRHPWDVLFVKARNAIYVFAPRLVPFHGKSDATVARIENGRLRVDGVVRRPLYQEVAYSAMASALLVLAAIGLHRRRHHRRRDRFLLLILATFTVVHAVFFPTTRLVSPMFFVLMFYAGNAVRLPLPADR
jgi:hypothetical protein